MRRIHAAPILLIAITLAAWPALAVQFADAEGAEDLGQMPQNEAGQPRMTTTVVAVEGTVNIRADADEPWHPVEAGQVLPVGTEVQTGLRGSLTLDLGPNSRVTVQRLSHFTLGRLARDGDVLRTLVAVKHGKIDFKVNRVGFDNDFRIATPTGTMAVKGTAGEYGTWEGDGNEYDSDEGSVNENNNSTGNNTEYAGRGGTHNGGGYAGQGNPNNDRGGTGGNTGGGDDSGNDPGNDPAGGGPDGSGDRDVLDGNQRQQDNQNQFEDQFDNNNDDNQGGDR